MGLRGEGEEVMSNITNGFNQVSATGQSLSDTFVQDLQSSAP